MWWDGPTPEILANIRGNLGQGLWVIPSYLSAYMTDDTDDMVDIFLDVSGEETLTGTQKE